MSWAIPSFRVYSKTFHVLPVTDKKDIVLGMPLLREQNPDVNWETLQVKPNS
ncbi:hypothetical protein PHMEG_00019607 [Phytophthora megakarya]|uniref:Uncharacterized protein n=1 Tax=Phytophthora megakarya TaxID=4795 RepID=A0A225VT16_9STRA|nr:hypothetical protein PHMEG_00019607 [Phytophthora megakarya]